MLSPSSLKREEYLKQKRNKKLLRRGLLVFFALLLIAFVSFIAHRPQIRISRVKLQGGVLVSETEVASATRDFISGSYLWLFPKNNFLLYPKDPLADHLKQTFKRIDTIEINRKGLDTIVVNITERKPVATWCDGVPSASVSPDEKCYFIDSNSTIFAEAPQFSGDAYFKYYGLVTTTPIGSGYIASTTEFAQMTAFVERTKGLYVKPLYIVGKGGGEFIMALSVGGKIFFDTKEPLSKASDNLEALLRTPALSQNISNLDYIDLRFGNKLYYKLK